MRFNVVAIGQRMPSWVISAWSEYSKRFPRGFSLNLREVPAIKRNRNADLDSIRQREGEALLEAVPEDSHLVALDEHGKQWTTSELSAHLTDWMRNSNDLTFLVGGPDGLSSACRERAHACWSLGKLTFPHQLVRVILAEQLYRAWSITQNHPYHRE